MKFILRTLSGALLDFFNYRSFLALEVTTGDNTLERYVKVVDKCFEEYKLEMYYQVRVGLFSIYSITSVNRHLC